MQLFKTPNPVAVVDAGWTHEFIEMMQGGVGHNSDSALLWSR
jgi:hypothetical protein